MWKIKIEYEDKSSIILTGKNKDISIRLARKYYDRYVAGHACRTSYQQYPKKNYPVLTLQEKIKKLEGWTNDNN